MAERGIYMTRYEIKQRAKEQLGNNVFSQNWLFAVLTILVYAAIISVVSSITGVGYIANLIIVGPFTLGFMKMFLKQARDSQVMNIGDLFKAFSEDFKESFLLGLMSSLFITLWSLLLVVPGIIKGYAYSMAFYIKADHPEYGWKQCLDESQIMMDGHKADLFVLSLSFIGWGIVGALCLGVGTLWVEAYEQAAFAQFYDSIKYGK